MQKVRADQRVVDLGLTDSRTRAQALILAGKVFWGDRRVPKPGHAVPADSVLDLRGADHPWVSRGGLKLVAALDHFGLDPTGLVALDIGASTGGFTDVLLHRGALRVYAVDVGHGQLAWRLRTDDRVVVLERTNARRLTRHLVPDPVALIVCDASFIGLATVLPASLALAARPASLVALVKPQFEAGPNQVGKGGIIRDPMVHARVCDRLQAWMACQPGWSVRGLLPSPITGADGNREFLLVADHAQASVTAGAAGARSPMPGPGARQA